jgi:hypothetical protein
MGPCLSVTANTEARFFVPTLASYARSAEERQAIIPAHYRLHRLDPVPANVALRSGTIAVFPQLSRLSWLKSELKQWPLAINEDKTEQARKSMIFIKESMRKGDNYVGFYV